MLYPEIRRDNYTSQCQLPMEEDMRGFVILFLGVWFGFVFFFT